MDNIVELFNNDKMSAEECLKLCLRNCAGYKDLLVIGWNKDGELFHHSSDLSKCDANWLIDAAKQDILFGETFIMTDAEENNPA